MDLLLKTVAEILEVEVKDLLSSSRARRFAYARHIVFYLARRELDPAPLCIDIARLFRVRHSSVIYGEKAIAERAEYDTDVISHLSLVKTRLREDQTTRPAT